MNWGFSWEEAEFIMKYNKFDFDILGTQISQSMFGTEYQIAYGSIPDNLRFFTMTPSEFLKYKKIYQRKFKLQKISLSL